jgi:hypothetical protein
MSDMNPNNDIRAELYYVMSAVETELLNGLRTSQSCQTSSLVLVNVSKGLKRETLFSCLWWLCRHLNIVCKTFSVKSKAWYELPQENNIRRGKVCSKMKKALWYAGGSLKSEHSSLARRRWLLGVYLFAINQCTLSWWGGVFYTHKTGCLIFII